MTQRYAHHCPENLRGGVEALQKFITISQSIYQSYRIESRAF